MKLQAGYDQTFQYVRQNAHGLTYEVGFHIYQRNDGTFIFGYEVVQEATDCRFGNGASRLDFEGTREEAEAHVRALLEKMIDNLTDEGEERVTRTGERAGYRIVEWNDGTDGAIEDLVLCYPELVLGRYVAIASCDSGPYAPTDEEFTAGWSKIGALAVSPLVKVISQLPMPGFDEWYVYDRLLKLEPHANFVNRLGFSPLNVDDTYTEEFWRQVIKLEPLHVLGSGTPGLFLVTRDKTLFEAAARNVTP
ncbi:hypothetical protein [Paraburkholderia haematera]|uniref:Uncharacterized protein n=1 Tax=Paraburkholderia haematera TaxID=2793077 RepID=A0ABM8SPX0_9BURK|nr:hypothetical protein [Paraburkholderia haematera]CAE6824552.1 hypothetical protein R69888_06271 [Paraburkholderia haematera]